MDTIIQKTPIVAMSTETTLSESQALLGTCLARARNFANESSKDSTSQADVVTALSQINIGTDYRDEISALYAEACRQIHILGQQETAGGGTTLQSSAEGIFETTARLSKALKECMQISKTNASLASDYKNQISGLLETINSQLLEMRYLAAQIAYPENPLPEMVLPSTIEAGTVASAAGERLFHTTKRLDFALSILCDGIKFDTKCNWGDNEYGQGLYLAIGEDGYRGYGCVHMEFKFTQNLEGVEAPGYERLTRQGTSRHIGKGLVESGYKTFSDKEFAFVRSENVDTSSGEIALRDPKQSVKFISITIDNEGPFGFEGFCDYCRDEIYCVGSMEELCKELGLKQGRDGYPLMHESWAQ